MEVGANLVTASDPSIPATVLELWLPKNQESLSAHLESKQWNATEPSGYFGTDTTLETSCCKLHKSSEDSEWRI